MEVKQEVEQEESERPYSESLRVRTSQEESDYCLFCFGREKLKDMFEKNESTSIYSIMIGECFKKQVTINQT